MREIKFRAWDGTRYWPFGDLQAYEGEGRNHVFIGAPELLDAP